jgi:hypothetical protein
MNEYEVVLDKATNYPKLFTKHFHLPYRQLAASHPWLQCRTSLLGMRASLLGINMSGFLLTPLISYSPLLLRKARLRNLAVAPHILGTTSNHPGRTSSLTPEMTDADWSNPVWDSIPAYHLTKEIVDSFLQDIFGYFNFYTRVSHADSAHPFPRIIPDSFGQLSTDHFQFWIPEKLSSVCVNLIFKL